jgi:hypothetical protein
MVVPVRHRVTLHCWAALPRSACRRAARALPPPTAAVRVLHHVEQVQRGVERVGQLARAGGIEQTLKSSARGSSSGSWFRSSQQTCCKLRSRHRRATGPARAPGSSAA